MAQPRVRLDCWRRRWWWRGAVPGPPGEVAAAAGNRAGLASKKLLNLNALGAREDLLPALLRDPRTSASVEEAARKIYYLTGSLPNVGGIRAQSRPANSSAS